MSEPINRERKLTGLYSFRQGLRGVLVLRVEHYVQKYHTIPCVTEWRDASVDDLAILRSMGHLNG